MSKGIRYDALLVRDLAAELHRTLAGMRVEEVLLDRATLRAAIRMRAPRRTPQAVPSLLWHLHPDDGRLQRAPAPPAMGGRVPLAPGSVVQSVSAPPDERLIIMDLDVSDASAGAARTLVFELVTNQWNALALSADGRITSVLRERRTGERELRAGITYRPPEPSMRAGRDGALTAEDWRALLAPHDPGTRLRALTRSVAFTSPLNAVWVLGDADVAGGGVALDRAFERYTTLIRPEHVEPAVLDVAGQPQPYSRRIGAVTQVADSLLEAFAAAAPVQHDEAALSERALDAIALKLEAAHRRLDRLAAQQRGASSEATELRSQADLLLAQLHRVPRGAEVADLDDFAGGTVHVHLDPALSAQENATRMYDSARRRARAAARIPRLAAEARRAIGELESMADAVRGGTADLSALERMLPRPDSDPSKRDQRLPYRVYRTSGGVEVRVGRGARANDALTFRHSSPTDVWLHARDVGGAHVILRWPRPDENPPASDIREAAVLAALFSRARTSGVVAVDWTRRKWVRKPRKAPPGLVVPERVRTLFVEPDSQLEERLRADAGL